MTDKTPSSQSPRENDQGGTVRNKKDSSPHESEVWLSALVDSAMDGIVVLDARQRIISFNPAAEAIFRCSAADALGKSINRFIPKRFRRLHTGLILAFAEENNARRSMRPLNEAHIVGLRADGQEFPTE